MGAIAIALAILPGLPAYAAPSDSDIASAKAALKEGRVLRQKKDLDGALAQFKAAYALVPTPITGYELGETHMELGQLLQAREVLVAVVKMPADAKDSEAHRKARADAAQRVEELDRRIPSLKVAISGLPEGAAVSVKIDGEKVKLDALVVPRKLNPGKHVIVARVSERQERREELDLKEGEQRAITIDLAESTKGPAAAPPPIAAPSTPPAPATQPASVVAAPLRPTSDVTSSGAGQRVAGATIAVAGVVVSGVGFALFTTGKGKMSDANCTGSPPTCALPSQTDDYNQGRSRALTGRWLLVAGGALAVGGVVLWAATPTATKGHAATGSLRVVASPFGAQVGGSF